MHGAHLRRGRRPAAVLVCLLVLVTTPTGAVADSAAEARLTRLLQDARARAGVAPAHFAEDLAAAARRHSRRMADEGGLRHNPDLGEEVSGWRRIGENVGRGPDVDSVHRGFMDSSGHRGNILDPAYSDVGVGVVVRDGEVWVTQVFRQPRSTEGSADGGGGDPPQPRQHTADTRSPRAAEPAPPGPRPDPAADAAASAVPPGDGADAAPPFGHDRLTAVFLRVADA